MSKKVIEQLKSIQSDAHVLYVKLHNFHWNVKGLQFHAIHTYTETLYDKMSGIYDDAAERVLQLGGKPVLTLGDIAKVSKIKDEKGDSFEAKYVLEAISKDFTYILEEYKKLSDLADKEGDKATVGLADEQIAYLEKELWMLRQTLA
ncbi:MAG: Dps family protein [Campylobacteraceae bacterium]